LQAAAVQFFAVAICGTLLTAVIGLFAYANAPNPDSHDSLFFAILTAGVCLSVIAGVLVARRAIRSESMSATASGAAYSMLKKYRRADTRPGADGQAGQYKIGERYLRELLGRRGS
jgi:hypothetical protein